MTAPADPTLCHLDDIPDGQARGFIRGEGAARLYLLVARRGGRVFGYHNECPHARTTLDWVPDQFMDPDGRFLQCATHGALFRVEDGFCVRGPCAGRSLKPLPLLLAEDGTITLA